MVNSYWSPDFLHQYTGKDRGTVPSQEAKYVERWPNTTSSWVGWSRFDIPVNRYGGVHSLLICTSSLLGFPTCHWASQQDNTSWAKYQKADRDVFASFFELLTYSCWIYYNVRPCKNTCSLFMSICTCIEVVHKSWEKGHFTSCGVLGLGNAVPHIFSWVGLG